MVQADTTTGHPEPLPSSRTLVPPARLHPVSLGAASGAAPEAAQPAARPHVAEPPGPAAPELPAPDFAPVPSAPARVAAPEAAPGAAPGIVVLPPKMRLSLTRLYELEREMTQLEGVGAAQFDVTEGGRVVVRVPPEAEERARAFLVLMGELTEGAGA